MIVYIFFIFLSVIFSFLYFFVKGKDTEYGKVHKLMFIVLVIALILEITGGITAQFGYNNSLFYNLLFVYLETCLLLYFFYLIFREDKIKKRIMVTLGGYIVFGLVNSFLFQPIEAEFHNYSYAFGSLALIFFAITFFLRVFDLRKYGDRNLLSVPYFWIVTVILFFYSATFFYFTPLRLLYDIERSMIAPLNFIIQFLAGLMYLVFGLAFYAPRLFGEKY